MMLRTGTKSRSGFSLIEVLITVAIVSLATVFIANSNLMNLTVFGRYENTLRVQNWALEKIAETKLTLLETEFPETGPSSGSFDLDGRPYRWELTTKEETTDFGSVYFISLKVLWQERGQDVYIERYAGLSKPKK